MKTEIPSETLEQTPRQRFDKKWTPEPFSSCWLWTANITARGYGKFRIDNLHYITAHRASWILHRGEIPAESCVLHKCDTPQCVNPDHLYLGTFSDNSLDKERKDRSNCARLSISQIVDIRQAKGTTREIAQQFGIAHSAVWRIQNRKSYSWVFPTIEEQNEYWERQEPTCEWFDSLADQETESERNR